MDWISIKADIVRISRHTIWFDNDVKIRRRAIRRIEYEDGRGVIPVKGKRVLRVLVNPFTVRRLS